MSQLADYCERNLFDAGGHTSNVYYIRIIRRVDSYVWDPTNKIMVPADAIPWEGSTTILQEKDATGVFPVVMPKEVPAGTYDITVYKMSGSIPQNTDDVEKQWETKKGGIFGF